MQWLAGFASLASVESGRLEDPRNLPAQGRNAVCGVLSEISTRQCTSTTRGGTSSQFASIQLGSRGVVDQGPNRRTVAAYRGRGVEHGERNCGLTLSRINAHKACLHLLSEEALLLLQAFCRQAARLLVAAVSS
eukprot:4014494-Prymnesium_polylepis.1